jgi:hypothetical protein
MRAVLIVLVAVSALMLAPAMSAAAPQSSLFPANLQGWTVSGDPEAGSPAWVADGGSGDCTGYARTVDGGAGVAMFWMAPPTYLGNQGASYGDYLNFDLQSTPAASDGQTAEVILLGPAKPADDAKHQLELVYNDPDAPPTPQWRRYAVRLTETGWVRNLSTGAKRATKADMTNTLASLHAIEIKGEYHTGADYDGLDDVAFGAAVPATTGLVPPCPVATPPAPPPPVPPPVAKTPALNALTPLVSTRARSGKGVHGLLVAISGLTSNKSGTRITVRCSAGCALRAHSFTVKRAGKHRRTGISFRPSVHIGSHSVLRVSAKRKGYLSRFIELRFHRRRDGIFADRSASGCLLGTVRHACG